jgi:hypothetical protein
MAVFRVRPTGYKYPVGLSGEAANTVVDYLVVAGGGGGGAYIGAGAGAGGFLTGSGHPVTQSTPYSITVGAGGPGGINPGTVASNGSNSIFSSITAFGGGRGSGYDGSNYPATVGGSGGGGRSFPPGNPNFTPVTSNASGTPGQGNAGGIGNASPGGLTLAAGGGGAGGVGGNASGSTSGNGGSGTSSSLSGTPVTYAAGGGGGAEGPATAGTGTPGVSGNGTNNNTTGGSGGNNTGGGGGGSGYAAPGANTGGSGGKGIVIIRYSDVGGQRATGGTVTTPSGYVVHTFTGDGTFSTNANFGGSGFSIN